MTQASRHTAVPALAPGALTGYRVIDLTTVLFGPLGTQTLGDWGADVIKVESLDGDLWRYSGVARQRGMSGQFMAVNRNKRSLAINLKHDDGRAVLARLLERADVLVSNIRPAGLGRLGFGYEACRALNPTLIYVAATGFDQDGPWAERPAFDEVVQAASGFAAAIGSDAEPAFVPSLIADKICAVTLTTAIVTALLHRERTGEGQRVEVPMLETLAAFNSIEMLGGKAFSPSLGDPGYDRVRARRPAQTKDGWITMLPYSGEQWCDFFHAVGEPQWIDTFAVRDPVSRARNIDALYERMRTIARTRTTAEWEALLLAIDVPHAPFAPMETIEEQEQLQAVELFYPCEHPSEGKMLQTRPATKFSASPASIRRPAPRLGEHSVEILQEIGYAADKIGELNRSGAIYQQPDEPPTVA